jgi:hypothetical protein
MRSQPLKVIEHGNLGVQYESECCSGILSFIRIDCMLEIDTKSLRGIVGSVLVGGLLALGCLLYLPIRPFPT